MTNASWRPSALGTGPALAAALLALALNAGRPAPAADVLSPADAPGKGPAYDTLGAVPIMHGGRITPIDTVARIEVKAIHGRESIPVRGEDGTVLGKWGPVAAFYGWTAEPAFWDDQAFVLVEYLPLKQALLAGPVKSRLAAMLASEATPAEVKARAKALAEKESITAEDVKDLARAPGLPGDFKTALDDLAIKLSEETKFFTPRELDEARVEVEGRSLPFLDWTNDLRVRQRDDAPVYGLRKDKLNETEKKAIEVADRLLHYRHIRGDGDRFLPPIDQFVPRPHADSYIRYAGAIYRKIREIAEGDARTREASYASLSMLQEDTANTVFRFLKTLQGKNRKEPGTDADFDRDFADWLREDSDWTPLAVLMESDLDELATAGFPREKVEAFREAARALKAEESDRPGRASEAKAVAFAAAARDLGASVGDYPSIEAVRRETRFNASAPFYWAPWAYGIGFVLLLLSVDITARPPSAVGILGSALYVSGLVAFVGGIGLEVFGFYSRILISGWAPVTNMYETVIWVGGVAAVIGLVLEGVYRKRYPATAAAGVALLATLVAASAGSTILDPTIKSIPPVLRSNYWLTIHVLTIVSSYAAFALAMGVGLIATCFYLTATYRRPIGLGELSIKPLLLGLPLAVVGILGYQGAKTGEGPAFMQDPSFALACGLLALAGVSVALAPIPAFLGELFSRATFRESASLDESALAGDAPAPTPGQAFDIGGGVATLTKPSVAEIRARQAASRPKLDAREQAMQRTAALVKPLAGYIYRAFQVGVLLVAAGTILGGVWADYSWGRFWGWDPKEVWALITLLVYLVPLHGRFAGWINTWGLVASSVLCFASVMMAWYGVNFVLGVGLHSYGFAEGGSQEAIGLTVAAVFSLVVAAGWRRRLGLQATSPAA